LCVLVYSYRLLRKIDWAIGLTNISAPSQSVNDLSATELIPITKSSIKRWNETSPQQAAGYQKEGHWG
jgi:hypothetical protein